MHFNLLPILVFHGYLCWLNNNENQIVKMYYGKQTHTKKISYTYIYAEYIGKS